MIIVKITISRRERNDLFQYIHTLVLVSSKKVFIYFNQKIMKKWTKFNLITP